MSKLFGPVRQLGLVVRDFDATLHHWATVQGIGPFFYFTDMPVSDYLRNGTPAEPPVVSIAFSYSGDLQIEIIHQQNDAPSCYLDFLATGREGIQHVSGIFDRPEFDRRNALIRAAGLKPINEGSIGGVRFAYFDTSGTAGATICEISESDMDGPRQIFDTIRAAAANWDGKDPIRPLVVE